MIEMLFTQALGLVAPWQVKQVDFNREAGRIDFQVAFGDSRHVCPACGAAAQPLHDRLGRSWRVTNHPPTPTAGKGGIGRPWRPA